MDREDYERAWSAGYDAAHPIMQRLLKSARSADELRQMAEGVSDLLQQAADDMEAIEKRARAVCA